MNTLPTEDNSLNQSTVESSTPTQPPADLKPSSKKKWIIIGSITVVILLLLGGAVWFAGGFYTIGPTTTTSISPTPTGNSTDAQTLKPLSLGSIEAKLVVTQNNKQYLTDYSGDGKKQTTMFAEGGMSSGNRKCAYYVKNYSLYRAAIDGSQEQLVATLDPSLFEIKEKITEGAGPGYGITVAGVDTNCQQAIVNIHLNKATDTMAMEGVYYVAPETNRNLIALNSEIKEFKMFVEDKPMFLGTNDKLFYTINSNGIFAKKYDYGVATEHNISLSSSGLAIYNPTFYDDSNHIDPVTDKTTSEKTSQIVEEDLNTGKSKALTPTGSFTMYQLPSASPDFVTVFYIKQTGLNSDGIAVEQHYLYNRSSGKAQLIPLADDFRGSVGAWLDNNTFLLNSSRKASATTFAPDIWKCQASTASCELLLKDSSLY